MSKGQIIEVQCPHCGFVNRKSMSYEDMAAHSFRPDIWACDSEEGGCEELYAVTYKIHVSYRKFTLEKAL